MMPGKAILAPVAMGVFLTTAMAGAMAADYTKPELKVIPAEQQGMTLDAPPDKAVFRVDDDELRLKRGIPPSASVADDLANKGFEIRMFRTSNNHSDPEPWHANQNDCDVYLSLVFKGLKFSGDYAPVTDFTDDWLVNSFFGKSAGYFVMVVEEHTEDDPNRQKQAPDDMWEVFRLKKDSAKDYFHLGRHFEVDPAAPGRGHGGAPSPDKEAKMKQLLDAAAKEISAKFNCYQPKPILASGEQQGLLVAACTPAGAHQEQKRG
jgi:hypothetical protein